MTIKTIPPESAKYKRGMNPISQKNLIPFPKGSNGGSRPGWSLLSELKHALANGVKRKEFIDSTLAGAILREPTPFKEVWDRVEGKLTENNPILAPQTINILVMSEEAKTLVQRLLTGARTLTPRGGNDEPPAE